MLAARGWSRKNSREGTKMNATMASTRRSYCQLPRLKSQKTILRRRLTLFDFSNRRRLAPLMDNDRRKIELMTSLLTEGLVRHGHDVTLFATGDSVTRAHLSSVFRAAPGPTAINDIELDAIHAMHALRDAGGFDVLHVHAPFAAFRAAQGPTLEHFATHCALTEAGYAAGCTNPFDTGIAAFQAAHAERIGFHAFLQWLCEIGRAHV